jgi:hypothetical protein
MRQTWETGENLEKYDIWKDEVKLEKIRQNWKNEAKLEK